MSAAKEKKACSVCKIEHAIEGFYKCRGKAMSVCKSCYKEKRTAYYNLKKKDFDYVLERRKYQSRTIKRSATPSPEKRKEYNSTHISKYPEKIKARDVGKKIRKTLNDSVNHHWSYQKDHWADVIEIPKPLHFELHKNLVYDQSSLMYRRLDNQELLDSKQKHLHFIESLSYVSK